MPLLDVADVESIYCDTGIGLYNIHNRSWMLRVLECIRVLIFALGCCETKQGIHDIYRYKRTALGCCGNEK